MGVGSGPCHGQKYAHWCAIKRMPNQGSEHGKCRNQFGAGQRVWLASEFGHAVAIEQPGG
ncbi:hypothetical protein RvVAR0630_pl00580 (plasmid) [Agrobacterium vitis]|nr:hypothetical protein RvVAR0630_pl00580 [Agrobacterium vitis]